MPTGYMWAVGVVGVEALAALRPLRRPPLLAELSFILAYLLNELPFVAFYWLLTWMLIAAAQGELGSPAGLVTLGAMLLTTVALGTIVWRGAQARPVVERALHESVEAGGGAPARMGHGPLPRGRGLLRILFAPLPLWRHDVRVVRNIRYGDAGRRNRLDLYRHRSHPSRAPVLIHFHGGHFRMGGKSREGRPLLHRLASEGWICVSATYRVRAAGRFPNSLVDAKRVIAWVREHVASYGGDPTTVIVAGSSAGAHLASMAALSPNDPAFQPGFEDADTSVAAAVCLYGYYGPRRRDSRPPSSPLAYVRPDAPPFFIAHGDNDTNVPVASAREFASALRDVSTNPVVYAELPGGQHAFDLVHSIRYAHVIDGIEEFVDRSRLDGRRGRASRYRRMGATASPWK